jgi:hypothetical protein
MIKLHHSRKKMTGWCPVTLFRDFSCCVIWGRSPDLQFHHDQIDTLHKKCPGIASVVFLRRGLLHFCAHHPLALFTRFFPFRTPHPVSCHSSHCAHSPPSPLFLASLSSSPWPFSHTLTLSHPSHSPHFCSSHSPCSFSLLVVYHPAAQSPQFPPLHWLHLALSLLSASPSIK